MNLLEPILDRARRDPDAPAVSAPDGDATYGELLTRAADLAAAYRAHGVPAGGRVVVLVAPGREFIAAAVAAMLLRAAYVPVDPAAPPVRLRALLDACTPDLVVSTGRPEDLVGPWRAADPSAYADAVPGPDTDVAYVVHTSGSTGTPKGIEIEHRSVTNLFAEVDRLVPVGPAPTGSWWASPDFDASVWEYWSPLVNGGRLCIVPPDARWEGPSVAAFLDTAGVASGFVPAAFLPDLVAYLRARPGACPKLRRLMVGVEPLALGLLQDLIRARPGLSVINGYGPAEATICCTLYVVPADGGDPDARTPIGSAVAGNRLRVLDPDGNPATTGELVVEGVGVARGYIAGRVGGFCEGTDGARAYRTGDLVRVLEDGLLLFVGRVDRQLKVRGYRIEPGEVEAALRRVLPLRDVVVAQRDATLVAYLVTADGTEPDPVDLRRRLTPLLSPYAVPAVFVVVDAIPLTRTGKTDHEALGRVAVPLKSVVSEGFSAAGDLADVVRAAWRDELGHVVDGGSFVHLGGGSLGAVRVAVALRAATGRTVRAVDVLLAESASALAGVLASAPFDVSDKGIGRTVGPLSSNQLSLWLHDQMDADPLTYVEPLRLRLTGPLDATRLAAAVEKAAAAHPAFGAVVEFDGDEPRLVLGRHRLTLSADRSREPFDVEEGPLARFGFTVEPDGSAILELVFHHIVVDGWSMRLLLRDLGACYRDPDHRLAASRWTLCDATTWLRERARSPETLARVKVAAEQLADLPLTVGEPTDDDTPGPPLTVEVPPENWRAVQRAATQKGVAPYALVHAAYRRALSTVFTVDQLVIGCAVAGRTHPEFAGIAGDFVDTVLLDGRVDLDTALRQEVPFAEVIGQLRASGRPVPPDFPQFYLSVDEDYTLDLGPDVRVESIVDPVPRARFDSTLILRTSRDRLYGVFESRLRLLSPTDAQRVVDAFIEALPVS